MNPYFSVVIPTYNRADLILETLESVFNQTFKDFEIIVVDNGSKDNTLEILKQFEDNNQIQIIRIPENIERARARNEGFKKAKGQYLTLLDSDDFMYEDNLKDAFEFSTKNAFDFFHNYFELVNSKKEVLYSYRYPKPKNHIKALANGNFISCIGVFISKKVYENYFFNENEQVLGSEDWELWLRVISEFKLGVIPKVNNGVRFHKGRSISAYNLESIIERKMYIIDSVFKLDKVIKTFGKYKQEMISSSYVFAAIIANENKLYKAAKKYLKKALKLNSKLILDPRFVWVFIRTNFKLSKKYQN